MKKLAILSLAAFLTTSCKGQENKKDDIQHLDSTELLVEQPKGRWKVDKKFDKQGNLIQYDSIYSWSSYGDLNSRIKQNPDSLLQSFRSKFYRNFSDIDTPRFGDLFAKDSLFAQQFFDDDFFNSQFGKDFMDIDKIREQMESMQQKFLERYQSEYESLENENPKDIE
ncbi:hypothetical protein KCTC52924_03260 [Arenibacter antarcticus]|uniref:Uncharacterized protein n=1 Tax=Arenibacter antarcticus TaxID=2040469 RepID=A0ABW5VIE7_9FLAO|nr:hypothetical protein [Arenibacter sp. H213]MCM4166329.1 hypothetical protein [Arenibacter sp. H213]